MNSAKIILVGFGYWGRNVAKTLNALGSLGVIVEADAKKAAEAKRLYPGVEVASDFCAALKRPETAVYIATPAVSHAHLACEAMAAGKDALVEKPMCLTAAEAEKMLKSAAKTGRILMTGHLLLYHPAVLKLKEMIDAGELGKILYIYSNRLNFGKIRTEENSMWSFAPHDISVMNYLLGGTPQTVTAFGSDHLTKGIQDTTLTYLEYAGGAQGHIFVSWLHPYKEQRMVVVGEKKMAVFSDTEQNKLVAYDHEVKWEANQPVIKKAEGQVIDFTPSEPLKNQCAAFIEAIRTRKIPLADGNNGAEVIEVLDASDRSLKAGGKKIKLGGVMDTNYFCHETACVDAGAQVGEGTKIWHFSHILTGAKIGKNCVIGQNVNIDGKAIVGNGVKIQNNVSIYSGVEIEDDVFLGPSCVLTNVKNPRSEINRHSLYEKTVIGKGATVGANSTIVCGLRVGRFAFVGAGAVVTKDVPDYALVVGNPAHQTGWMSRHGHLLANADSKGIMICPESGMKYQEVNGVLACLDLPETKPLPESQRVGKKNYDHFKKQPQTERTTR